MNYIDVVIFRLNLFPISSLISSLLSRRMGLLRRMPELRRVIQPTANQNDKYAESPVQHAESPVHGNRLCRVGAAYIYVHSRELNSVQQDTPLPLFQDQTSEIFNDYESQHPHSWCRWVHRG